MSFVYKFIYDLFGRPFPKDDELKEEIERLLFLKTVEQPDHLFVPDDNKDQIISWDSEVLNLWLTRKFKSTLILLYLSDSDNYPKAKAELCKMERYGSYLDKFLRPSLISTYAINVVKSYFCANTYTPELQHGVLDLKKTLTLIAEHLDNNSSTLTLLGTDSYTKADITLYNYLKRILAWDGKDYGLASHVRHCDPLKRFLKRYADLNARVIDISSYDPLASKSNEANLAADIIKPACVGLGFIIFYLWSRRR